MKVAVLGDTHLGRSLYSYDLTGEIRGVMYNFFKFCVAQEVHQAIHLGDLFDNARPSLEMEKAAIQWVNEFERAQINLYILAGNHDVIAGSHLTSALDGIKAFPYRFVNVVDQPRLLKWEEGVRVLLLPFPSPGQFTSRTEWDKVVREMVKQEVRSVSKPFPPRLFVFSHLAIDGAETGTEGYILRGGEYIVPEWLLEHDRLSAVVSGHIHKQQQVGSKLFVLGSALKLRFDEEDNESSFGLVTDSGIYPFPAIPETMFFTLELDGSAWSHGGNPPSTDDLLQATRHIVVKDYFVKIVPVVDAQTSINWGLIRDTMLDRGARLVVMDSPIFCREKQETEKAQTPQTMDPKNAAKTFIKSRLRTKEDRVAVFRRFKKLQEETDHE